MQDSYDAQTRFIFLGFRHFFLGHNFASLMIEEWRISSAKATSIPIGCSHLPWAGEIFPKGGMI